MKMRFICVCGMLLCRVWAVTGAPIESAGTGNWHEGTTWIGNAVPGSTADVIIGAGHTVTVAEAWTSYTVSNLTVNGTLTHAANNDTNTPHYKIDFHVFGNLTLSGDINVIGKGYAAGKGPGRGSAYRSAGTHGGRGNERSGTFFPTYGSLTMPFDLGSGGQGGPGGGAVRLKIDDTLFMDGGTIKACGRSGDASCGAGGSIQVTADYVTGTGAIWANGGDSETGGGRTGGGGGRIAVTVLSGSGFDQVEMMAIGGWGWDGDKQGRGGAGTIYQRSATQDAEFGILTIDNNGYDSTQFTMLSNNVTHLKVGDVALKNSAKLRLYPDTTLFVNGSWSNCASFTADADSTVVLNSTNTATLYGNTTFQNLVCTNGGKRVYFEADSIFRVDQSFRFIGEPDNHLHLYSSVPDTHWKLQISLGQDQVKYVDVDWSNASLGATVNALDSQNGGNTINWSFPFPGQTNCWNGSVNENWGDLNNWDLGQLPGSYHQILIPDGAPRYPLLGAAAIVHGLHIESGGSLRLNGYDFTVLNDVTVGGELMASDDETITFHGNAWLAGGSFASANSTVVLNAETDQFVTTDGFIMNVCLITNPTGTAWFLDGVEAAAIESVGSAVEFCGDVSVGTFYSTGGDLVFSNNVVFSSFETLAGNVCFNGNLTGSSFTYRVADGKLTFGNQTTTTVERFSVHGSLGKLAEIRSREVESAWFLEVLESGYVTFVDVQDSDASAGISLWAINSVDRERNSKWVFDQATWWTWDGGVSSNFAESGNWIPATAPEAHSSVLINGDYVHAPCISQVVTVSNIMLGGVTSAVLVCDALLTVEGNMWVLDRSVLTHSTNHDSAVHKLECFVKGSLVVLENGRIDVSGKGYAANQGAGRGIEYKCGGAYGGEGGVRHGGPSSMTYGSITYPADLGSGGRAASGGGCVVMLVNGAMLLDGMILANGNVGSGAGSGGSVNIDSATMSGSGRIFARGGAGTHTDGGALGGGGGRIAIVMRSGNDFGTLVFDASGGDGPYGNGAAGTVYLQRSTDTYGRLIVNNRSLSGVGSDGIAVTLVSSNVSDATVGDVLLEDAAMFELAAEQSFAVYGAWSNAATFAAGPNSSVYFAGPDSAIIHGDNIFYNLALGGGTTIKPLSFAAGKTQTVLGDLSMARVRLRSASDGEWWHLMHDAGGTQSLIKSVDVKDSNAGSGQTIHALAGLDAGNNVNWQFRPTGTLFTVR